ncbi:DUF6907 domain-containing protein [Streptomyces umbrinus]
MSHDDLRQYGPTEIFDDEGITADAVVRVAYALSRQQLLTALSIGYTEMGPDREPGDLTVQEVRTEVEGWLAAQGIIEIDRYVIQGQLTAYPPERQAVIDALAAALDRAYPPDRPEPVRQPPRYGKGTVTLETLDHGVITLPDPAWCAGHGWQPNPYLADVTHNSVKVKAGVETDGHGWVDILEARVSHAPYLVKQPEPHPIVAVQLDVVEDFAAEDIPKLVRGLQVAIVRLQRLAGEALHTRGGAR